MWNLFGVEYPIYFKKNIKILNMKLQLQETRVNVNKYTRLSTE